MVGTSNGIERLRMNLGIDLGTGSVKAALVAPDGYIAARASKSYTTKSPHPGWVEMDAHQWVDAAASVMDAVDEGENTGITAVGFSGQMHGVVIVDEQLRPLRPAILWADTRSGEQARRMTADLGPELLARLGSPAVAGFAATTLRWLADNEPEVIAKARYVLQAKDFLRVTLGGPMATDPSDASGTLLFDVTTGQWNAEAVAWAGITEDMLPPMRSSTEIAGEVRVEKRVVPCAIGAADTAAAISGLGLTSGEGFIAVGTGAQIVRLMNSPALDPALATHTFCTAGAAGDGWYRIGAVQSAGLVLTAALDWLGASVEEASAALHTGVKADDPIFVPYLAGERTPFMNPDLRGAWLGMSLATDRAAMLRSVLEGVAQAVALGVEAVQASGERLPDVVPLIGGGTQHPDFRQLLADACGVPLGIAESPAGPPRQDGVCGPFLLHDKDLGMTIAIGSDHAGFHLKSALKQWLKDKGYEVLDLGTDSEASVDYPSYGAAVGRAVVDGQAELGVAVCGSGQGICMAANKVHGVRAGIVRESLDAEMIRRHNNANVACFGERFTDPAVAVAALEIFLTTEFEGGRHERRVNELAELDTAYDAS